MDFMSIVTSEDFLSRADPITQDLQSPITIGLASVIASIFSFLACLSYTPKVDDRAPRSQSASGTSLQICSERDGLKRIAIREIETVRRQNIFVPNPFPNRKLPPFSKCASLKSLVPCIFAHSWRPTILLGLRVMNIVLMIMSCDLLQWQLCPLPRFQFRG